MSSQPYQTIMCGNTSNDSYVDTVGTWEMIDMVLYTTLGVVVIVFNISTLIVLYQYTFLGRSAQILVCGLACADLALSPCCLIVWYLRYIPGDAMYIVATIILSCGCVSPHASLLNILAITVDRFWAVKMPIQYASIFTTRRAIGMEIFLWTFSLLFYIPITAHFTFKIERNKLISMPVFSAIFPKYLLYIFYGILSCIMVICFMLYFYMYLVLKRITINLSERRASSTGGSNLVRETVKTMFIVLTCLTVSWTPYVVVSFWATHEAMVNNSSLKRAAIFTILLAYSSSMINPVIYTFRSDRFRKACLKLFQSKQCLYSNKSRRVSSEHAVREAQTWD